MYESQWCSCTTWAIEKKKWMRAFYVRKNEWEERNRREKKKLFQTETEEKSFLLWMGLREMYFIHYCELFFKPFTIHYPFVTSFFFALNFFLPFRLAPRTISSISIIFRCSWFWFFQNRYIFTTVADALHRFQCVSFHSLYLIRIFRVCFCHVRCCCCCFPICCTSPSFLVGWYRVSLYLIYLSLFLSVSPSPRLSLQNAFSRVFATKFQKKKIHFERLVLAKNEYFELKSFDIKKRRRKRVFLTINPLKTRFGIFFIFLSSSNGIKYDRKIDLH